FKNIVKQLEVLKRRLTWQAWTQGASELSENIQYESLFQGFRMVGSITKVGTRCRAFKVGQKATIEYLNHFVPEEYRVVSFAYKSDLPLKQAKEKYPEWYQRRIVEKRPRGTWVCNKALYDWWIRKTIAEAQEGHRYWCVLTLATYAKKCGVPLEQLEKDAFGLIPRLSSIGKEPFTEDDVLKALEAFNDSYITYPVHTIEYRTGIRMPQNKRNGRKQAKHLEGARAVRDINNENWREGNGRPDKADIVREWRKNNPDGKKIDCERATGLSRHTILKWWDN
ncbi:MAG: hypothetical protein K6E51_08645, partial [Treponema sp.]|nr:hypothetical protein [Treponema sp.]